MIITSFEEELRLAPANSTSVRNNPFGPIQYGAPIPVGFGGLGEVVYNKGRVVRSYIGSDQPGESSGGINGLGQLTVLATANPILGAVAGGLSIAQMIGNFLQPSQTGIFKQDATTLVNGLEDELKAVDSALRSNPTCENQAAAINFFWTVWGKVVDGCSAFGGPGTACVNDRGPGGKVSWWNYYLNPWTQLKCTEPTQSSSNATTPVGGANVTQPTASPNLFSGNMSIVLVGAIALAAVGLMMDKS